MRRVLCFVSLLTSEEKRKKHERGGLLFQTILKEIWNSVSFYVQYFQLFFSAFLVLFLYKIERETGGEKESLKRRIGITNSHIPTFFSFFKLLLKEKLLHLLNSHLKKKV